MDHSATIYLIGPDGLVQGLMQRPTVEEMVQAIRDALSD
jgi:cytochrome oxidase Cu insertion factor (SCO1/SenC/PrrC family)